MGRGQSLIVWAIAEGRAAAAGVDRFLVGETALRRRSNRRPHRNASHIRHSRIIGLFVGAPLEICPFLGVI